MLGEEQDSSSNLEYDNRKDGSRSELQFERIAEKC